MWNIVCGGEAGQGINVLASIIAKILSRSGFYTFTSREYESRIRGGHNSNTITFSSTPINSNPTQIDILIALDKNTENIHKSNLKQHTIILQPGKHNMYYAGEIAKIMNINFSILESELRQLKNFEENSKSAEQGYNEEKRTLNITAPQNKIKYTMTGSEAFALGALSSGIDFYYSYPMTPAKRLSVELSKIQIGRASCRERV